MKSVLQLRVNGRDEELLVDSRAVLAEVLRDELRLTGTHIGCGTGSCGACTVLLDGEVQIREYFALAHHFKQEDLFDYGMQPQFLSRFDNSIILEDLHPDLLKRIFLDTPDSVFKASREFFKKYGIELEITDDAARRVAEEAAKARRIGARALKDVYGRIIKPYEFDPFSSTRVETNGGQHRLVIDDNLVAEALKPRV